MRAQRSRKQSDNFQQRARSVAYPSGKRRQVALGRARVERVRVAVRGHGVQERGAVQVALLDPGGVVNLVRQLGHPPGNADHM